MQYFVDSSDSIQFYVLALNSARACGKHRKFAKSYQEFMDQEGMTAVEAILKSLHKWDIVLILENLEDSKCPLIN